MKIKALLFLFGLALISCKKEEEIPIAPQNLRATINSANSIFLSWNDIEFNESGYVLERKTTNSIYKEIKRFPKNSLNYIDTGLQYNTTYIYRLYAINSAGIFSSPSNEAQSTTMDSPSLAPSGLTINVESSHALKLNWIDQSTNESSFVIERKVGSEIFKSIATVTKNIVSFIDSTVIRDSLYTYRVKSINANKLGNYSNEATGKAEWIINNLNFSLIQPGFALRTVPNKDSSILMLSGYNNVLKSIDNGNSWQTTLFPSNIVNDYGAGYADIGTDQWIFGTNGGSFISTTNQGNSFSYYGPSGWGCGSFFLQGLSDGRFIASKTGFLRGIYKSSGKDNSTWNNVFPGIDPRGIAINQYGIFIAAGGSVILKSTDMGNNWISCPLNTISNDLTINNDTLYWLDESSNLYKASINNLRAESFVKNFGESPGTMWPRVGIYNSLIFVASYSKGFFISKDGGKNWVQYNCSGASIYYTSTIIKNRIFICTNIGLFVCDLN